MKEDIIAMVNANAEEAHHTIANAAVSAQNRRRKRFERIKEYVYAAAICAGIAGLWLLASALAQAIS